MSFPRYPTYKPSGVEWLGEVPEHWSVNRFKLSVDSCANGVWGDEASNDENDVICIRVADFDRHRLEARVPDKPTIRNVSDRDIEQRSLRAGDLLIEKSGGGEKQPVGAVVLYIGTAPAVCSNFVARMRLKRDLSPSFWRYSHHAAYSVRLNMKSIKQTSGIQNLDQQQYLDESAAYPPLEEQLVIAGFLDRETTKIDALIAEQRRLIELLQEKRQAVISHAVTKGLNPNEPMKDSGVEWLGEVPEHWEVARYKRFCELQRGHDLTGDEREEGPYPVVTSGGINGFHSEFIAKAPGVVTGRYGSTGTVFYIDDDFWPHNTSLYIKDFHGNSPRFSWYLLQAIDLKSLSAKSAVPGIDRNDVHAQFVAFPHLQEQIEIASYLDDFCEKQSLLTEEAEISVGLLQERRSALISAAVTGQIDVRGLVEEEGGEQ